ncbi:hemophore-related protein [Mycobacterium lepraemurium]|nr:hemophore-related protein [Mycobacterium lepraemurium]ATA27980.1 hemophore-related protein [Mycobacterium lepraemurium]
MRLSLSKLGVAVGSAAVALTAAAAVTSADPMDAIINTTCNYGQVIAALNASDPAAAQQLNSSPMAQSYIQRFLASPPTKRQQMAQQIQGMPAAQQYIKDINQVAVTCNNF